MSGFKLEKYAGRIARLVAKKKEQTLAKYRRFGKADEDDYGYVLPPEEFMRTFRFPVLNENGSFHGVSAWAKNYRALLEAHPVYVDPDDALAGRWMFMMSRMRAGYQLSLAPFPVDYSFLHHDQELYDLTHGIGKDAHFAPDYRIGLSLGWGGLTRKVERSLEAHKFDPEAVELLNAELEALAGIRNWIHRTAMAAEGELRRINLRLENDPPETLREACQWIAWFNMASRTYNRDGAGGQLDEILRPYYERDIAAGRIDDEDAVYYIACLLLNDPHYYQIGGPAPNGKDQTSRVSFLILEAAHALKTPCNLTIRVHDRMDEKLFRRGVEILLEDNLGYPRFSGDNALIEGFMRNGYSIELARERIALGCNWMSIPGREYTLNDTVKINLMKVFEVAFNEIADSGKFSLGALHECYQKHLARAAFCIAEGLDFHLAHQYRNEPELLLNLLCYGPIEKGRDASHGGVDFYNMCCDGAGLAVVADSFAALQTQVVERKRIAWKECVEAVRSDFRNENGEQIRRLLASSPRFGHGGTCADEWAVTLTHDFAEAFPNGRRTPEGRLIIPGLFSWADTLRFGKTVGATPNGRRAGEPSSHGANPCPGFRKDGAATAVAKAVASVQCGYGNTSPLQLELDASFVNCADPVGRLMALFRTHFKLGGTLINVNIVDAKTLRAAQKEPEKFPDLIVRVTGFTSYFIMLSPEFRDFVIKRIIEEEQYA
ncbi:pyruvate formate lyase family protein [Victivallis vadensis]|uniref:pyruvate formate lyase family protein n=1 Tax=Victivallis vadensis TaxID=172901 RepID=UPI003AF537DE